MSTCTTTPDSPARLRPDRHSQAQAIRSTLDTAAAAINAQHAAVLGAVIDMHASGLHRSAFGFSALRDLLLSQFDFTFNTAGSIAAIARLSGKFRLLAQAATTGKARIDQVAYAVRQLDKTPAMRLFARTPFRAPVRSPFDASVECTTPEAMVGEYCAHAPFKDLQRHLDELAASLAEESELLDGLGEQSLQWIDLAMQGNGMWSLSGELTEDTGRLLDKYLKTACPPPRQEEQDEEGLLPPQANRHAEALHQLLAGYGSSPEAATRHGHTATLDLVVDIETLQGKDTGRLPLLEGTPISVAKARLLACEAGIIPSVFDYEAGEAVELGRALRLPNTALRRKLELEQAEGCAWTGCSRPISWTEAHHVVHWADGGLTNAENLILLCRFHHGRIHSTGWTVEKTGPGQAVITHHDHATGAGEMGQGGNDTGDCGCADWRTDADLDAENQGTDWDVFPTGLYRSEWSEAMKPDLNGHAEMAERHRALEAIKAARAKCREKFTASQPKAPAEALEVSSPKAAPAMPVDYGDPPFLGRRLRWQPGRGSAATPPARNPKGFGPTAMHGNSIRPDQTAEEPPRPLPHLFVAARSDRKQPEPKSESQDRVAITPCRRQRYELVAVGEHGSSDLAIVAASAEHTALLSIGELRDVVLGDLVKRKIEVVGDHGEVPKRVAELLLDVLRVPLRKVAALVTDDLLRLLSDLAGLADEAE